MSQRLDKWLVYARFVKHRSTASDLVEGGRIRVNNERVTKCHYNVKPDDILTIALANDVRVVKVLGEAERRGPASAASRLYVDLRRVEKADADGNLLC